jgi:hypothetical protein
MQARSRRFDLIPPAFAAVTGAIAIVIALFVTPGVTDPTTRFVWVAATSAAATGALVAMVGPTSATAVYAVVCWCFHFGLVAALATGYASAVDMPPEYVSWVFDPITGDAAIVALCGLLAFASGACLIHSWRGRLRRTPPPPNAAEGAHPYGSVGAVLVFGAIATWCVVVLLGGGVAGFVASYEDFRQMTAEYSVPISIISPALAFGLVLAATGKAGWHRRAALLAFAGFAVVALPIGLRTDVMFPAVAVVVASARSGRAFSPVKATAVGLALVLLIPVVRELRTTGIAALPQALAAPRLDALVEMGGSLRPVEQVVRWHAEGEPFEHGASYWAPFERAASRLLPGLEASSADDDLRLMNVLVLDRIGAIGFSPVAEAYRNFGPAGVLIVLALIGALLGAIDTIENRQTAVLALATVYPPLLINVRNSFVSVPAQCVAGILCIAFMAAARHVATSVTTRAYARPADNRSQV